MHPPLTRSRTSLFLSYRDSTPRSRFSVRDGENDNLIQHVVLDVDQQSPQWLDISEQVELILSNTGPKIQTLDKLHAKHILPGFSDRSQEERDIEALTTDITRDLRQCQTLIQKVTSPTHVFPPNPHLSTIAAKNVQRGLAAKLQDLSATFRKKQRVYMERLQGHAAKNQDLLVASGAVSLMGSDAMNALDDDMQAASQSQSQSLINHPNIDIEIQTRDRELSEIAKSISSLAELFKDLSVLVIDQGTLLDSVQFNIEQTAVHMEDAVKELDVATRYQKNTGKRKCILLLVLICFGLVVVLILKPKKHTTVTSPTPVSSSVVIPIVE